MTTGGIETVETAEAPSSAAVAEDALPEPDHDRIEKFLLEDGLITPDQVAKAERIQSRLEEKKTLTALVVELGWVSPSSLEASLKRHRKELTVEEILVQKGLLDRRQLVSAVEAVRAQPGLTLRRFIVESGAVSDRDYLKAFCEKNDLPFIDADVSLVDHEVLKKVSLKYLARHHVLPLSVRDGRLSVLVDSPDNRDILAELERIYKMPVSISLGSQAGIAQTLAKLAEAPDEVRIGAVSGKIQYHEIVEGVDTDRVTGVVDHIFLSAIRQGASDVHLEPLESKLRLRFRIDGSLVHITEYPKTYAAGIIARIKVLAQADIAEHRVHQDGRINLKVGDEEVDLRASFYVTVFGENAVLRILRRDRTLVGLEEMGFSPAMLRTFIEEVLEPATGIVLVTGPTGSGKTTTLYAAVDRINDPSTKIITAEDPVEYVIEGITQCSVANRPGINFVDSLKAIVRQDPDVILIGEIRDRDSANMAIQSALTGHKVFSTFHTEDSVGALIRLIDMNIETFLIASTVTAVLAQRLVRRQCVSCREDTTASPQEMRALSLSREELLAFPLTRGRGCEKCLYTGFKGRVGIYELMLMSDPIRDAILSRAPAHELRRIAHETPGFVSLQEDGIAKALMGRSTLSEVVLNAPRASRTRPLGRLLEKYE